MGDFFFGCFEHEEAPNYGNLCKGCNSLIVSARLDDGGVYADNKEKLQQMVASLECSERILHSDDSPPPTLAMNQLYGLIIRHVRLGVMMFYIERGLSSHGLLCCEKPDKKDKLIHLLLKANCVGNSATVHGCLSGEQVQKKAGQLRDLFSTFNGLLEKCRKEMPKHGFCELTAPIFNEEGGSGVHFQDSCNDQELGLLCILRDLERMGCARSYAPPEDGEIQFYQEIRKRATSCLEYMEAKPRWQLNLRKWPFITKPQGVEPWNSFYREPASFVVTYAPTGYRMVTALDEYSDFLSIVRESKSHFLDINSCLLKGELLAIGDEPDIKSTSSSVDQNMAAPSENKVKEITRKQYLQNILKYCKKLEPLTLESPLQVKELRLYGQVVEHVTSSIWMYETIRDGMKCDEETTDDTNDLSGYSKWEDEETGTLTREQCLVRIVQLVEAIRTCFSGSPPTEQENLYYKEIEALLNTELLNPELSGLERVTEYKGTSSLSPFTAMYEQHLQFIYGCELSFLKEVEEHLIEMVTNIFAELFEGDYALVDPLKMIVDYLDDYGLRENAAFSIVEPYFSVDGLKVFNRLILITTKLANIFNSYIPSLGSAHKCMDGGVDKVVALEASSAIDVLLLHPNSPQVHKNFWGRCRALEVVLSTEF